MISFNFAKSTEISKYWKNFFQWSVSLVLLVLSLQSDTNPILGCLRFQSVFTIVELLRWVTFACSECAKNIESFLVRMQWLNCSTIIVEGSTICYFWIVTWKCWWKRRFPKKASWHATSDIVLLNKRLRVNVFRSRTSGSEESFYETSSSSCW